MYYFGDANINRIYEKSNSDKYGRYIGSGTLQNGEGGATMTYDIYADKDGKTTSVYASGYVGEIYFQNGGSFSNNPYQLPLVDHHQFDGKFLDNCMFCLFYGYDKESSIYIKDTSNVTNMSYMFANTRVKPIDVSHWDTSKVVDMRSMFYNSQVNILDVSNWDTSNVTDMNWMFGYSNIQELDVSKWDTSQVLDMSFMFYSSKVKQLDVSHFNTSNVIDMSYMFVESKVRELDLSHWDISRVIDMSCMFAASQLKHLDLSCLNISTKLDLADMFYDSQIDTIIYDSKPS